MSAKRAAAASGIQPPPPPEIVPLSPPVVLTDEDAYSAVLIADADVSTARVTDLRLAQVVCRQVRFTQAELERTQLTDVQHDTCDLAGATPTRPQLRRPGGQSAPVNGAARRPAGTCADHARQRQGLCWNTTLKAVCFEHCSLRGASFTYWHL